MGSWVIYIVNNNDKPFIEYDVYKFNWSQNRWGFRTALNLNNLWKNIIFFEWKVIDLKSILSELKKNVFLSHKLILVLEKYFKIFWSQEKKLYVIWRSKFRSLTWFMSIKKI